MSNIAISWLLAKSEGLSSTLAACPDYFTPAFRPAHFGHTIFNTIPISDCRPISARPPAISALDKRAERNEIGRAVKLRLVECKDSPLIEAYNRSLKCTGHIEVHGDGDGGVKMKTRFCGCRWCPECSAIRSFQAVDKYRNVLMSLAEVQPFYFVTLTRPNVPGDMLRDEIRYYADWFRRLRTGESSKLAKGRPGFAFTGLRVIECTYNSKREDYHPHMHLLVQGLDAAEFIRSSWLADNPSAVLAANDLRAVTMSEKSILEVVKYSVKSMEYGSSFNAVAVDWMYQCFTGVRSRQAFGALYGIVQEDELLKVQSEVSSGIYLADYYWNDCDWRSPDGVLLVGRSTNERTRKFVDAVSSGGIYSGADIDRISLEIRRRQSEVTAIRIAGVAARSSVLSVIGSEVSEMVE